MTYVIFGCGTPIRIEANSTEHAEHLAVDRYGVSVDRMVTLPLSSLG